MKYRGASTAGRKADSRDLGLMGHFLSQTSTVGCRLRQNDTKMSNIYPTSNIRFPICISYYIDTEKYDESVTVCLPEYCTRHECNTA